MQSSLVSAAQTEANTNTRTPAMVKAVLQMKSLLPVIVPYLDNKDIASLRLVSRHIKGYLPASFFWRKVNGVERLLRVSPVPEEPARELARTDSQMSNKYDNDPDAPSVPGRFPRPYSVEHVYETIFDDARLNVNVWDNFKNHARLINTFSYTSSTIQQRLQRDGIWLARENRFSMIVKHYPGPGPIFPNLQNLTWSCPDDARLFDTLLNIIPPGLLEFTFCTGVPPHARKLQTLLASLPQRAPNLVKLRLEFSYSLTEDNIDGMLGRMVSQFSNLQVLELVGFCLPPKLLEVLSRLPALREIRIVEPDRILTPGERELRLKAPLRPNAFPALTHLIIIARLSYVECLLNTPHSFKSLQELDITIVDSNQLNGRSIKRFCTIVSSNFPTLRSLALREEDALNQPMDIDAEFFQPLAQCKQLECFVVDWYQDFRLRPSTLKALVKDWPLLKHIEIRSVTAYLSLRNLLLLTRHCRLLREVQIPLRLLVGHVNVTESLNMYKRSGQDIWRAQNLRELRFTLGTAEVQSKEEVATFLHRVCPPTCLLCNDGVYQEAFIMIREKVDTLRAQSALTDQVIQQLKEENERLRTDNAKLKTLLSRHRKRSNS
ncbi:unnamed protein product [Somion occarium]|uniref:F-box domain-containing protein n=1 Tax=Somion occarium TaxID=3059160 RepID=A0ABP1D506_9APHY